MVRKISPELEKELLKLAGQGKSMREIASFCGTAHGVKVTHQAVAKLLAKTKQTRADATKAVIRDALAPHVTTDLASLEELRLETRKRWAEDAGISHADFTKLATLESSIISKLLDLSGASTSDQEQQVGGVRVFLPPESDD